MNQTNKYSVQRISPEVEQDLSTKDEILIPSYSLGTVPFIVGKYQLDASFYTPDNIYLETAEDIRTYSVLGVNQGENITEISVDPVQDALDSGYLGDVQVEYKVTNNLFSPSHDKDSEAVLFIREISTDRTEIRATSTTLTEEQMQGFAQDLYRELNTTPYFKGVSLNFIDEDNTESWCINVMTEVIGGNLIVTFKTYEPLPSSVSVKSRFTVLEQIGEPVKFEVVRTVEVTEEEDTTPRLKGPNFDIETPGTDLGIVTDYLNFKELFSYPEDIKSLNLYSLLKEKGVQLGIDHSDFSNFVHFSSAAERLENFRYKLGLIQDYEHELELEKPEAEKNRIKDQIQGIIDNFDHYDRYLYFEKTDTSWPKILSEGKPYINVSLEDASIWFTQMLGVAQEYDSNNPDILINSIPKAIREDSRNEPYIIFVHMIGQQFDDEWVYAKAVSERYNGDNRLDFGISKDLVQDALKSFGIELETTNQNLNRLFDLCVPGQPYNTGSESSVTTFKRATINVGGHPEDVPMTQLDYDGEYAHWVELNPDGTLDGWYAYWNSLVANQTADGGQAITSEYLLNQSDFQPVLEEDYRKEIYKRIYHNLPLLLKTKGTSRGLRALISCFGIPEDLLEISVAGGANLDQAGPFFGPEYETTSSLDRIRLDDTGSKAPLMFDETTGTFISGTILSLDRQIEQPGTVYQHGTNNVEVGFRLNAQFDKQVKDYLVASSSQFDYDDIVGDPRNTGEDYGEAFTLLRNQIIPELWGDPKNPDLRTPTAILRLIRYYDSVLFRTLQQFVPARDVVSTGAIVDDNILHRNKYKGVEPEAKDLEIETGSIEMVFIDGGEGGCLKVLRGPRPGGKAPQVNNFIIQATSARNVTESRECPTVDYVEKNTVSIGTQYVDKVVFDDSPRYDGELAGTVEEVTDGELNKGNKYKKGGFSSKIVSYVLDYRFLCLPRFPIDTILKAVGSLKGYVFPKGTDLLRNGEDTIVEVGGTTITGELVADMGISTKTTITVNCRKDTYQGCLFSSGSDIPKQYVNYPSLDPALKSWAGEDVETYIPLEYQRIFNLTYFALSPEGMNNTKPTTTVLNLPDYVNTVWVSESINSNRKIYPRTVDNSERSRLLTLKFNSDGGWAEAFDTSSVITLATAGTYKLYTLQSPEYGQLLFDDLTSYPELDKHMILKIFLYVKKFENEPCRGYVVIDFKNKIVYQWDLLSGEYGDYGDWIDLKRYYKIWLNATDVQNYLDIRYKDKAGVVVMGVEVEDNTTGISFDPFGSGSISCSLVESYTGCPYIFSSGSAGTGTFQMLLEDWV